MTHPLHHLESSPPVSFNGSCIVTNRQGDVWQLATGDANRSERLPNTVSTRFGIASGCKLFTAIAICQLIERGQLELTSTLRDCLLPEVSASFGDVTIEALLTHTSNVPDYFDETEMDDFETLWETQPMYRMRRPADFLPLFRHRPLRPTDGAFRYNNAGYILLGLIVEQVSKMTFTEYVEQSIFAPAEMLDSGYFTLDALPERTALGYIDNEDGTWRTNHYAIPIQGGPDGGAFVTAPDFLKLWDALLDHRLLRADMTARLLTPHIQVNDHGYYGYGIWIQTDSRRDVFKYHVMGYDPGVSFHAAYYPKTGMRTAVCSNHSDGAFDLMKAIETTVGPSR